jgi:hypothetical protein
MKDFFNFSLQFASVFLDTKRSQQINWPKKKKKKEGPACFTVIFREVIMIAAFGFLCYFK